ncbi:MAG: prepilin-type N-terminal cleavage/methylation domain-containing protein [Acidobacteriia bacterium]|nr:prepilin-type N-terminal cleavage/methylation domain-containing protein [Terriglobia bacterium]
MGYQAKSTARGFTLVEMMVSLALGLLIVGAAVKLFSQGVDATWVVSQRAEMQQDLRATENLLVKDLSLAGAGLTGIPGETVALPSALGSPIYGCDQSGTAAGCPPNGGVQYPCIPTGACTPSLYPIMPGFQAGIKPPGSTTKSDLITVVYSDNNLALNCYSVTFNGTGNILTFTAPANPPPTSCILPPGLAYPQALNNTANGLQAGDVILVNNQVGTNSAYAVGEVTLVAGPIGPPAPGVQYVITFADGDALKLNQSGQPNDLTALKAGVGTVANRIFVVTYYLRNVPDPTGVTTGTTILYRQVNGLTAVPVADNMANLQFTYDTYDDAGNLLNAAGDAGESVGTSPNLIRKVNLIHLTMHSQLAGTRSVLMATSGFQSVDMQTSISARNASYKNRYGFTPPSP